MQDSSAADGLVAALLALDRVEVRQHLSTPEGGLLAPVELEAQVVRALEAIGTAWEHGAASLSQVYMSARLCEELLSTNHPPVPETTARVAVAVLEDHHLLGKRIVVSALRAAGIALRDYGSLGVQELVERTQRDGVEVLLISTLMLRSALRVKDVVAGLGGAARTTRVIVGGAPFRLDPALGQEVGADAVGFTAADAPRLVALCLGRSA